MRVGFIGLGEMGLPMARNLAAAGHDVAVFDRDPARCSPTSRLSWPASAGSRFPWLT